MGCVGILIRLGWGVPAFDQHTHLTTVANVHQREFLGRSYGILYFVFFLPPPRVQAPLLEGHVRSEILLGVTILRPAEGDPTRTEMTTVRTDKNSGLSPFWKFERGKKRSR